MFCKFCTIQQVELISLDRSSGSISLEDITEAEEMLQIFRNYEYDKGDGIPNYICNICIKDLKSSYNFFLRIKNAKRVLQEQKRLWGYQFKKILPKTTTTISSPIDTEAASKKNQKRKYICEECIKEFSSYRQLLNHHQIHEVQNVCRFCGKFYSNKEKLDNHVIGDHADSKFQCGLCSVSFVSRSILFRHLKKAHQTSDRPYRCSDCQELIDVIFRGRKKILDHIESTHPVELAEEQTQESTDYNAQGTVDHSLDPTEMNEEFLDYMDEEFLDEFLLNENETAFAWDELSLTNFDADLKSPTSELGEIDRYKCPRCTNCYFPKQHQVLLHLKHFHKDFTCYSCGVSFDKSTDLKNHSKQHVETEAGSKQEKRKRTGLVFKTPLQCTICDKRYKSRDGLKYHVKTHAGIKAFTCPYCQRKFIAKVNLRAHIRIVHTEIKANECNLCDRKFATIDHLKKHVMSVHQKERNHLCSVCGKGFSQASHLTEHEHIHLRAMAMNQS